MTNQAKNVPELRFPDFDGEWNSKQFKEITEKISDGIHTTPKYDSQGDVYFINGNNLVNGRIEFKNSKKITKQEFKKYKNDLIRNNSILISINGTIGNIANYEGEEILLGKSAAYLNLTSNLISRKFIFYTLQSTRIQKYFTRELTGTTIKNLSINSIKNTQVFITQMEEQQKIGEFFSKLDRQIELEEQKLAKLEEQKKGYMQKVFSQELRFKDENGNDYPEWEIKKLLQIAKVKTGSKNVQDNIQDGKYKFFDRSVEVKYLNTFDFDETAIIYPGEGSKFLPRYFSGKYSLHQRAYSIYDININNNYLYYYLSLQNNHFLKYAVGSTVKSLRMSGFDKLKVMVPKNSEQEKIGSFFKNLDEFIEKQANKVALLKQRKQSFLQKMFV